MARMKETELFEPVKQFFEDIGYEVYSEVSTRYTNRRVDIVAIHRNPTLVAVCELKTSLSLDLLLQAMSWKGYANYIYVAIPQPKVTPFSALELFQREGIGVLFVSRLWDGTMGCTKLTYSNPRLFRRIAPNILDSLTEFHKNSPPGGSKGGGYWTAYKVTMERVKQYLETACSNDEMRARYDAEYSRDGWRTIEEILDHCETHYAQPKPSLSKALQQNYVDWCETKKIGKKLYFRAKTS